jgi:hypothetical protein
MAIASRKAEIRFPAEAKDPRFRAFFDYWLSKAPPGRLPGRQHLDPVEMKPFLPYIILFDVLRGEGGKFRFRHRQIGSHVSLFLSAIKPGSYVDEIAYPDHLTKNFYPEMATMIETHEPHYAERKAPVMIKNFTRFCRLKLPLATDGETVDMIIGLYIGVGFDGKLMDAE